MSPPILTERTSWTKPKPAAPRYTPDLTPDEIANAKRALRVLRTRHGTSAKLAEAMGVKPATLAESIARKRPRRACATSGAACGRPA